MMSFSYHSVNYLIKMHVSGLSSSCKEWLRECSFLPFCSQTFPQFWFLPWNSCWDLLCEAGTCEPTDSMIGSSGDLAVLWECRPEAQTMWFSAVSTDPCAKGLAPQMRFQLMGTSVRIHTHTHTQLWLLLLPLSPVTTVLDLFVIKHTLLLDWMTNFLK